MKWIPFAAFLGFLLSPYSSILLGRAMSLDVLNAGE